jgi:trk system potassium uptake protein TrkH
VSPIRYRLVLKYTGGALLVLGVALLITASVSFALGEFSFLHYTVPGVCTVLVGWYLARMVPERDVTTPEVAAIAPLSFFFASLIGALPFFTLGGMPPVDAWFEAMSGIIDLENSPSSLLFMRSLFQWLGGLGFVVITVSLLLVSGRPAITLLKDTGFEGKLFPRIARHVRVIAVTYILLTLTGIAALLVSGLHLFEALCYTFSGISTGGFALHTGSVGALPRSASWVFMLIMPLGAINFLLYYRSWKTHRTLGRAALGFIKNPQVLCLVFLTAFFGLLISLTAVGRTGWTEGVFLAASAQTGTGFYILEPQAFPPHAMMLLIAAMFVGGSMGSTSGGIKLYRIIELFRSFHGYLVSRHYAKEVFPPGGIMGRGVEKEELIGIFYVITVFVFFIFVGSLLFIAHGYEPLRSVFEVTSAAATVGLSSGIVSPELPADLKVVLVFIMWAGRLEFIPLLVWAYSFTIR